MFNKLDDFENLTLAHVPVNFWQSDQ